MSGIVGIYRVEGRNVSRDELERMNSVLAHRGPDGGGVWCSGGVGLGHRMLHTTPESLGEVLPLFKPIADVAITADARIDNRQELIASLRLQTQPTGEITDSEIILAAYEKWGEGCPERLLGDFAFVIWDGRERRLFCARDPMGIKPLYYYHDARVFAFASEIKALLALSEVPRKLNEVKVGDYLVPVFNDQVSTYYENILRLPPAHSLTVVDGKLKTRQYWQLDPSRELRLGSDEEYVEAFRELFTDAVRCRMRSAFPVGSTLSGGLDSSSVACTASQLATANGQSPIHTFSAIFPTLAEEDPGIDERPFIDEVLAHGTFQPHYVHADRCRPLADVALCADEVLAAPNLYIHTLLFRGAQESGVRVLLTGFDGDVVVSYGYEYLEELARMGRWAEFAHEAQALADRRPGTSTLRYLQQYGLPHLAELARSWRWRAFAEQSGKVAAHFPVSRRGLLLHGIVQQLLYMPAKKVQQIFSFGAAAIAVSQLNFAINHEFAGRVRLVGRCNGRVVLFSLGGRGQHAMAIASGLEQYLLGLFDQATAALAVEQRYPMFDRRLLEFCLSLPFNQKLRNGLSRASLRRAMRNIIPPVIQWRLDKANVRAGIRSGLSKEREILDSVILRNSKSIEPYVDLPKLRDAYRRFLRNPSESSEVDLFTVYLPVSLALWLEQSGLSNN